MSNTTKPVIIIVTGAWHVPEHYAKVSNRLRHLGYLVECPHLLTNNNVKPADKSINDDVAQIRNLTLDYLNTGRNVVAVMHSYGGIVGTTAFAGLGASSRPGRAHVQALLYIAAFVPVEGESLYDMIGGKPAPWYHETEQGYLDLSPGPEQVFYNDVSEAECKQAVSGLVVQATRAQNEAPSAELQKDGLAWQEIPVTYLMCENDQAMLLQWQRMMTDRVEATHPDVKVKRVVCDAGHSPFLSQPERVVEVMQGLA